MRWFFATALVFLTLLSCQSQCSLPEKAPFRINDIDVTVVDNGDFERAEFLIDIVGPENGSEGDSFLVSLDFVVTATAPDGRSVALDNGGRFEVRETQPSRIGSIDVPTFFDVPDSAANGVYTVTFEVIDNIAEEKVSESVDVDFTDGVPVER